jgi:TonB C terminal
MTQNTSMTRVGPRGLVLVLALGSLLAARSARADAIAADKLPETPLADRAGGPEGDYLRALHAHIHRRWADNFLRLAADKLPAVNPLNQPGLTAEADIVVAPDGQLLSAAITRGSGFAGFDDAIIEVLRDSVPFPPPIPAVRSDDDKLHAHWLFARDQRRCAGVAVVRVFDPVDVALPKLLRSGRRPEALKRVATARGTGAHADTSFTLLANDWIKSSLHEPWATVRMARMLAIRGDQDAISWLKTAVRRPDMAADAGAALVAAKVPLCPLLKAWFETDNWTDHQTAAVALATANDPACVPGLMMLFSNTKAVPAARAAAVVALASIDNDEARKAVAAATKEDQPAAVRGVALLAQIKPKAGRPKVIAMEKYLRDPAPELRAAAAAGVVRAGGSANLDDLYVLFKDNDPRPALAALRELADVPGEEATKLIARLAKRPQLPVQKAAAELLVRRKAVDYYSTLKPYLDPKSDPELRTLALVGADEPELQAAAIDPKLGTGMFRVRLARGERDKAIDWFLAYGTALPPPAQADVMVDWLAAVDTSQPTAAKLKK